MRLHRTLLIITISISPLPLIAQSSCFSANCHDQPTSKKTPMEKLKDERILNYLNKLWDFYYNRNLSCFSNEEKGFIEIQRTQIRYPAVSAERMSSEELRVIILSNAESLSLVLEKELANPCQRDVSLGTERKILTNLKDLHAKVEQKIDDAAFWLWDQVEYMSAGPRRKIADYSNR